MSHGSEVRAFVRVPLDKKLVFLVPQLQLAPEAKLPARLPAREHRDSMTGPPSQGAGSSAALQPESTAFSASL